MPSAIDQALERADSMHGRLLAEAAEPWIAAVGSVFESECGEAFSVGRLQRRRSVATQADVNIVIAVTGEHVAGLVVYGMDYSSACKIVSRLARAHVTVLDAPALETLRSFVDLVTGRVTAGLEANGFASELSPPQIVRDAGAFLSSRPITWLEVPVRTALGLVHVGLALRSTASWAEAA
jgi:CheY-specific phosphatase CheX